MEKKNLFKIFFLVTAFFLLISPVFVLAQAQITISTAIPGTTANGTSSSPGAFVANFYQFALIIGGVLAFGVIVYGGIRYMTSGGNPHGAEDAKEWIEAALLGLVLLAGAYFILSVVNPQLLNLNLPPLSGANVNLSSIVIPGGSGVTVTSGTGGTCKAQPAGPCSVASLQTTCMGSNAGAAAQICNAESSGNALNGGDPSTNGQPVSIGLFQVNLTANNIPHPGPYANIPCTAAFDHSWHAPNVCGKAAGSGCGPSTIKTDPTSQGLYASCVAAAQNVTTNINYACSLSKNGKTWTAWSTSKTCNL